MISFILAAAIVAAPHDPCEWSNPGSDPYRIKGDVTRALSDLSLSPEDRKLIGSKMDALKYDDMVAVTPQGVDSTTRKEHYAAFRDMHSGHSTCHGPVTTKSWAPDHRELALVYCGSGSQCVLVPLACNNIGLVDRVVAKEEPVAEGPINIEPAAGPQLAPVEDKSIYPVATTDEPSQNWPPSYGFGGGGFYGGGGGGGGFPPVPPHPPASGASGPSCGCVPPPHHEPPPPVCVVPEPASSALFAVGILGLLWFRLIRRRSQGGR